MATRIKSFLSKVLAPVWTIHHIIIFGWTTFLFAFSFLLPYVLLNNTFFGMLYEFKFSNSYGCLSYRTYVSQKLNLSKGVCDLAQLT